MKRFLRIETVNNSFVMPDRTSEALQILYILAWMKIKNILRSLLLFNTFGLK